MRRPGMIVCVCVADRLRLRGSLFAHVGRPVLVMMGTYVFPFKEKLRLRLRMASFLARRKVSKEVRAGISKGWRVVCV